MASFVYSYAARLQRTFLLFILKPGPLPRLDILCDVGAQNVGKGEQEYPRYILSNTENPNSRTLGINLLSFGQIFYIASPFPVLPLLPKQLV